MFDQQPLHIEKLALGRWKETGDARYLSVIDGMGGIVPPMTTGHQLELQNLFLAESQREMMTWEGVKRFSEGLGVQAASWMVNGLKHVGLKEEQAARIEPIAARALGYTTLFGMTLLWACTRVASTPVVPAVEASHTPSPTGTHTPTATETYIPTLTHTATTIHTATPTGTSTPGFPLDHFLSHDAQGHAIVIDGRDAWGSLPNLDANLDGKIDPSELQTAVGVMGQWSSDVALGHQQHVLQQHDVITFDKLVESLGLPHGALSVDDPRLAWLSGMDYSQAHAQLAVELSLYGAVVTLTTGENLSETMVHLSEQLATVGRDLVGPAGHVMTADQIFSGLTNGLALEGKWHAGIDPERVDEIRQMCLTDRVLTGETREAQPESAVHAQWDHSVLIGGETIDASGARHLSNGGMIGVETRLVEASQIQDVLRLLEANGHHATVTKVADGYSVVSIVFDFSERSHTPMEADGAHGGSGGQLLPCGIVLGAEATPGARVTPPGHGPETPGARGTPGTPPTSYDTDTPHPPDQTPTPIWTQIIPTLTAIWTRVVDTATAVVSTLTPRPPTNTPETPPATVTPAPTTTSQPPVRTDSPTPRPTDAGSSTAVSTDTDTPAPQETSENPTPTQFPTPVETDTPSAP